jgi:hypothetical protein
MDSPEQAEFLADTQGNDFRIDATGKTITFDSDAWWWFASRPDTDDGHIDSDDPERNAGNIWLGGMPYQIDILDGPEYPIGTVVRDAPERYTAWITTDPSCLDADGRIDVVVLRDEIVGCDVDDDRNEVPVWSSAGESPVFSAKTTNDASEDIDWDGPAGVYAQVVELLEAAGWSVESPWETIATGAIAVVQRD